MVERFKRKGKIKGVLAYIGELEGKKWRSEDMCPKCLKYQFTNDFNINISDKCCVNLKEKPVKNYQKLTGRPNAIIGLTRDEGGRRSGAVCLSFRENRVNFQPLVAVTKEWEKWLIDTYNIDICILYKPPFNFKRTGCKGCPFAKDLQKELDTLEHFFPSERKQCEYIWKPVYNEYRRIGYRLKKGGD